MTVDPPAIRLPRGGHLLFPDAESTVVFPYELVPEKTCSQWIPVSMLKDTLRHDGMRGRVRLVAVYNDAIGRRYASRPLVIDLCEQH